MAAIKDIAQSCINCGTCVRECAFLQTHGTPGRMSSAFLDEGGGTELHTSYSCNLCGLCNAVCPLELDCSSSFLEMRRKAVANKKEIHKKHKPICNYVKIGSSPIFALDLISKDCDTIFFPGCTLSGSRAAATEKTYNHLKEHLPDLGIVLDCCSKAARDLGREWEFEKSFGRLVERLKQKGVEKIITACPSCYVTFKEHAPELGIEMVYQTLADYLPDVNSNEKVQYSVHDACTTRFEEDVHESVRTLARSCGVELSEMAHSRRRTVCCGEGGAASFVAAEIAGKWKDIRSDEMRDGKLITYCAGCSNTFGSSFANTHILDLLFFPEHAAKGKERVKKTPFTYISRLLLKRRLAAENKSGTNGKKTIPSSSLLRICLFGGLVLLISGLRIGGFDDYLHSSNLNMCLETLQELPPIVFVGLLALAPVFFLPAFPLVMIAGILFGHGWGLWYSLLGASLGASIAFLFSRYLASDWLVQKMSGSRGEQIHQLVTIHGWKVVLVLRLVPLFPFTPLNYCLGLTGIRFTHYFAATFIGIVPACAAFVFFSSSLWKLLTDGTVVPVVIGGIFLLLVVSFGILGKKILPAKINSRLQKSRY